MVDFPGAIPYFVSEPRTFINALADPRSRYAIVIHKTACDDVCSAESQGVYFQTNPEEKSAHYIVGKDGHVVQCVLEKDGAGANCCLENGYDTFWDSAPTKSNINLCTYSIEHCDYSSNNGDTLTAEQQAASFKLIAYLCHKYNIGIDHIKGHNSISPISKPECPGNYPWAALFQYLKEEGVAIPAGWNDKDNILTAPNGITVQHGFREYILDNAWEDWNWPLEQEEGLSSVEESNSSLGAGTRQVFRDALLEWTNTRGVYAGWLGQEFLYVKKDRDNCRTIIGELQKQVAALQSGIPQTDVNAVQNSINKLLTDLKAFIK